MAFGFIKTALSGAFKFVKGGVKAAVGDAGRAAKEAAARRLELEAAEAQRRLLDAAAANVPPKATAAVAVRQFGWVIGAVALVVVGLVIVLVVRK